jgi:predicted translin family RNA/ssDNA-binding protein
LNRIYKVIWSKAKNCYVVASELAKRHTKSPAGTTHVALKAGVLACVLAMNLYASPVMAAGPSVTYDDNTYATITLEGERVGVGTKITNLADGELSASSTDAVTGGQLYAVEQTIQTLQSGIATNSSTIANAQTAISNLRSKVATVESTLNTVKTQVEAGFNVTIGGARVKNVNPDSNYINFIAGDNITLTAENGGVKITADGAPADATVASGQTNAISGDTAYNELRPASDGNYIATASTTAANLQALDDAIKANEDAMDGKANVALDNITDAGKTVVRDLAKEAVKVVDGTNTTVTEGTDGVAKTYAVDVTANGAVSSGDTGIVTGGTVYDALQAEARPAADGNYITTANTAGANLTALDTAIKANEDAMDGKANVALDNITDAGKTVIQDATNVVSGDSIIDVTSATANGVKTYTVKANISADGQVASGNTGLVSGDTVYTEVRPASDGNYIATANTTGANLTALDNAVKANEDAIDDINDALDDKANVSLDNITAAGETVVKDLAKQAVNVTGTNAVTVTKTDVNGVDTYTVDVTANGAVASGDTGIVTGGTVYDALQAEARPAADGNYITTANTAGANLTALDTAIKANEDAMDGKANVALDNITDAGKTVIQDATNVVSGDSIIDVTSTTANGVKTYTVKANMSADGQIASGDTGLVNGNTVYTEVRPASDGNYIATANTTGANLTALDNAVKANEDAIDDINDALDNKANVGLDNITAAGETVVKDLAKQAVNVVGTNAATVTKTDVNGVDTYTVDVTANGAVASGDTGLVDGGTVYDALQDQKDEIDDALDTKANKDASNVAANTADWGAAIGTGAVVSGNGELVTGGTVYDALQAEARPAADGNYITAANTAGANLTALDTAIKANEDAMDGKANVALDNITDAGKTVIQDATNVVSGDTIIDVTSATANGVKTYTVKANITADGQVASGDTGLVSGDTVYNEVRPASDGNYIATANTTGANLTALDNAVKANEDAIDALDDGKANIELDNINDDGKTVVRDLAKEAVKVVDGTNTTVTEGTDGNAKTYAVDVTVDGVVASGNTGIVDGGTVYDALQDQKDEIDDALDTKANKDASNVAANTADWGAAIGTGAVESGNGELVTGGTVYDALQTEARPAADGNYITTANTAGANLTALDTAVKANEDAISDLNDGKANVALDNITDAGKTVIQDATNVVSGDSIIDVTSATANGVKTYTVKANITANGQVASGDTGLVSGDTIYNEVRPDDGNYIAKDNTTAENLTALDTAVKANEDAIADLDDGKANIDLDNITDNGKTVVRDLAKEAVKVVDGTNTTVTEGTDGNAKTYAVDVVVDGVVASGNTGIVDGGTVYDAIQDTKDEINDALDTKANKDASNVAANTADWGAAIGTGAVESGNGELVTGGTVYDALQAEARPAADGNYITTANTAGANLTALDTAVKANEDAIADLDDGKANVALDNITDDGKTVVRDLAKEAVKVVDGTNTTVTEGTDGNAKTYAVDVVVDGVVASGNTGIVDGGTVYDALQAETRPAADGNYIATNNTAGDNLTALDTAVKTNADAISELGDSKANIGLDNIDNNGKEVIRELAKDSINVVGGTNANVVKTEGTVDTYTVNVAADGAVIANDNRIVTGGTVYEALNDAVTNINNQLDGKADVNLQNINQEGERTIQMIARDAVKVEGRNHITSELVYDADGNAIYRVEDVVDGAVEDGNTGLVDGGTVFDAIKDAKDEVNDATDTKLADYALKDASNVTDANAWGQAIAKGAVAADDVRAVSGDTVFKALKDNADNTQQVLDGKANISLDNLNTDGKNVLQQSAITAVKVADGENTTVSSEYDADGNVTYKVKANATGAVAQGDTGLVDGGTVYDALQAQADNTADALDTKANVDASNVTDANAWGEKIATGAVAQGDVRAVSGDTVYNLAEDLRNEAAGALDGKANVALDNITDAGKDVITGLTDVVSANDYAEVTSNIDREGKKTYTIEVKADGQVAQGDTGIVNGDTVYNAIQDAKDETADALDGKANVGLDNISEEGKDVITGLTDVVAGENIVVDSVVDREGKKTYTVSAPANGQVASGDTGLVSGGTVYDALQTQADATADALDGKANVALDNITDEGKDVITGLTDVVSGDNYSKVESAVDREGKKTYTVTTNVDGVVASGNTGIVNGDTVYNAIQNAQAETADALDGKANVALDNITEAGKDVITGLTDVVAGENIVVDSVVDREGKKTYTVSAPADGQIASGDTGLVSGGTVYDALQTQADATADALDGKANVALDNITDEGKDVITGLTDVVSGDDYSKVESAVDREGKKTYTVTTNVDGAVASGDTGIVTGGTVYDALKDATDAVNERIDTVEQTVQDGLDGKANVGLDNLSDAGKDVLKTSAQEAVKLADGANTTVTSEYDANGNITYKVEANATGAVEANNTGLVDGGTVYDALQAQSDGIDEKLDTKANKDASNVADHAEAWGTAIGTGAVADGDGKLVTGDTVFHAMEGRMATDLSNMDEAGKDVITGLIEVEAGNEHTEVTSNVSRDGIKTFTVSALVDGEVAENDNGAVTGGKVYEALKEQSDATAEALDGKANVDMDNLTDAGNKVLQQSAIGAVKVADGENTTVSSEFDADGNITYKVKANTDGAVEQGNAGIVSGGTVYDALQAQAEDTQEALDTKANVDASNVTDSAAWAEKLGTGEVEANNAELVTGDTVYNALKEAGDATQEALDGKANVGLDNLTNDGKTVLQQSAISAVKTEAGNHVEVTPSYDANGNVSYKIDVKDTGAVESGNTELVTGGTVYDALQQAASDTQDALDGKANVNLDNIDADGKKVITGLTDVVAGNENTEVTSAFDADGKKTYTVSALTNGQIAEGNTGIVDGGAIYDALKEQSDAMAEGLDGKANVGLDNLTTDGKTVLRTSAQEAVKVSGEGNAVVTPSYDANGNIDYKIAITEGAVAADDTGLVSGKTIYEALQTQAGEIDDKLDGKANVALDNITREGKDVITNLTEVKAGDAYTNVTHEKDDDGKVTYTVNAVVDGAVESGNEGLVTGGQVADAIGEAKSDIEEQIETLTDETNEALDTKANRDMDNLTDAGVREIKTLAQEGVKVEAGEHAEVESTFDQNGNKIYTVSAIADGAVERNNEGLVSGSMVFDETRPAADGEFISKDSSAGENLSALDAALKDTNDAIAEATDSAVKYDSAQKGKVTLEGEDGTKITNLKDADLTDESTDAVTGRQLKATNDIVDTHTEDIAGLKDMSNLTDTGKETVKDLAKDAVGVEAGDRATVTSAEVDGKMVYTVSANNDGVIEAGNTDLVSGNTVYEALQDKADTNLGNLTAEGKDVITGLTEVVAGENVRVDSTKSDGKVTYTVNALGNGIIEDGNTGLVTGDTVFNALSEAQEATEEALEGKANVDMDNLTDAGKTAVKTLAKEAVKVKGDGYAEVTKEEEDGNYIYTVNVKADGVIEANNTGLVTGGMVANETKVQLDGFAVRKDYTAGANLMALDNALKDVAEKADALDANTVKYDTNTKARITLEGEDGTKIDNVKAGALTSDSMEAVNGSQLFATNENVAANAEAIEGIKATIGTMEEGEYIDDRNTVGENLKALDDAIVQQAAETEEALAGKANTDMDNLTDTGKQNVKDLAKEAVTVSAGDHVSIVTTEENGNIDYQVNVVVDGKVEEGNTGIVDGGTVYEAIQEVAADVDEKLEGKANTNLDNITDEGKQVIRDTMAEDLAGKANVDASNVTDANAWGEKIATGEIAEGEVRAVNGDTVNSALNTMSEEFDEKLGEKADKDLGNITPDGEQKIKDVMADDLAEKADKDLDNITDEGKEVIRELSQDSVKLEDGETTRVSSRIDADGSKIYKVEALAEGEIEAGDNRAVSGNTMADFIDKEIGKVKDGNHVQAGKPIAENINALDTAVGKVEDGYFVDSNLSMGENINVLDEQVARNTKGIASLYDNQIMIKKEMREGLAKSAALAGLHPFENDTDQKWNIAAAMGGYRGEHAAAIGLFYRPSDRVMVNAGTTITDSDNMYNVGVSVALDKGSGMSKSQMKQRIGNLEDIIRKMAHKIDSLEANQLALTGMTKEFPDVPANHWAHNAVVNLHGSDIVQGYPDGEFKGAKPMTRYEYAEMLFNALEKGKTLPKEVVSEYSQELEQIRQNRSK